VCWTKIKKCFFFPFLSLVHISCLSEMSPPMMIKQPCLYSSQVGSLPFLLLISVGMPTWKCKFCLRQVPQNPIKWPHLCCSYTGLPLLILYYISWYANLKMLGLYLPDVCLLYDHTTTMLDSMPDILCIPVTRMAFPDQLQIFPTRKSLAFQGSQLKTASKSTEDGEQVTCILSHLSDQVAWIASHLLIKLLVLEASC
jgi:hypothetical protein